MWTGAVKRMSSPPICPWVGWYGWVRLLIVVEALEPNETPIGVMMDQGAREQFPFPTKTYPEVRQHDLEFKITRDPPISVQDLTLPHLNQWSGFFVVRPSHRDLGKIMQRLQDAPLCRWCGVVGSCQWVLKLPTSPLARHLVAVVPLTSGPKGESLYLFRVGPKGGRTAQLDMSVLNSKPERLREFWRGSPDHET